MREELKKYQSDQAKGSKEYNKLMDKLELEVQSNNRLKAEVKNNKVVIVDLENNADR